MLRKILNSFAGFWKSIYVRLVKINDTPLKIALGLALGVFMGIMPGVGPIASLFVASLVKANRAAALLGSLITNTWLSIVTFLLSVKIGSTIMGANWEDVDRAWEAFAKDYHWADLFTLSAVKVALPVVLGYVIVAFFLAVLVYIATLLIIMNVRRNGLASH